MTDPTPPLDLTDPLLALLVAECERTGGLVVAVPDPDGAGVVLRYEDGARRRLTRDEVEAEGRWGDDGDLSAVRQPEVDPRG